MTRRLPNLGAMRTFEAAARHGSFTRAAHELGVTPAAVSYVVRELEDQIGSPLFLRSGRAVTLSDAGIKLNVAVAGALQSVGAAVRDIREAEQAARVNVTTTPSLAIKWLVPRLNRFLAIHPDIDVRVDMSHRAADLQRDNFDIAIRFGNGDYRDATVVYLLGDSLAPVCSPELARKAGALRNPADLRGHTLIHVDWQGHGVTWPTWEAWLEAAKVTGIDHRKGLRFDQSVLALQAAIDGLGVALGDSSLTESDLEAGRLVKPFALGLKAPANIGYWLLSRPGAALSKPVAAFRDWLLAEARLLAKQPE